VRHIILQLDEQPCPDGQISPGARLRQEHVDYPRNPAK
jgi:hypothetical protein